jgi:hypothetical protein
LELATIQMLPALQKSSGFRETKLLGKRGSGS